MHNMTIRKSWLALAASGMALAVASPAAAKDCSEMTGL